jgi:GAF domain-containing protein
VPERLIEAIREFSRAVANPFDLDALLQRLTDHATVALHAAGAGIMLQDQRAHGRLCFAAASSELITRAEQMQHDEQTGPCTEAFETNERVVAEDLANSGRWPGYSERAVELGLLSVVGVPLNAWGQTIGVLNVYRSDPSRWTGADLEACEIVAAMAAGYILNASNLRAQHELAENLQRALESRGLIERAKGIIMADRGVDATRAFDVLRHTSQQRNVKLRDVAEEIASQDGSR